jgi:hypothetical protein
MFAKLSMAENIWVELKNKDQSRDWQLGENLRALVKGRGGRHSHELMRAPKRGDLVIHIQQTKEDGWSIVAVSRVRDRFNEPGPNDRYYKRGLTSATEWQVPINKLLNKYGPQIRREIDSSNPKNYPFRRHGNSVGLIRVPYLSKATNCLVKILLKATTGVSNNDRRAKDDRGRKNDLKKGSASPPSASYIKYAKKYELKIDPAHHKLQTAFTEFLETNMRLFVKILSQTLLELICDFDTPGEGLFW